MPRRPALTVLLLTDREVVRADFATGRQLRVLESWRRERPVEAPLGMAAELAISSGPKLGRRVLVLATSLWTQVVSVPVRTVEGLSDEELAQTLKFEVESFSGIGAFESRLAFHVLYQDSEEREFWVSQVENRQLAALEDVLAARGNKLIGVGHPSGLPVPQGDAQPWKRLEFWPEAVCCVQDGTGLRLFFSSTDPRSPRWQAELEHWQPADAALPVTERLVGPGVTVPEEHLGADPVRLDDAAALERWLLGWASQVEQAETNVPLLRPVKKAISKQTRVTGSIVAAAVAAVLCALHLWYLQSREKSLAEQIAALRQPAEQKRELTKQLQVVEKERDALEEQLTAVEQDHRMIDSVTMWRDRLGVLLNKVSNCCSEEMMITQLLADNHGLTLEGRSHTADAATRFASRLRPELAQQGWRVEPPTQEGKAEWENGGPWDFRVVLREIEPVVEIDADEKDTVAASEPVGCDKRSAGTPSLKRSRLVGRRVLADCAIE